MDSNNLFDTMYFYQWLSETSDLLNIQSVNDLLKSISEFICKEIDFNTDNLFE